MAKAWVLSFAYQLCKVANRRILRRLSWNFLPICNHTRTGQTELEGVSSLQNRGYAEALR